MVSVVRKVKRWVLLGRHEYDRLSEQSREKRVEPIEEKIGHNNILTSN